MPYYLAFCFLLIIYSVPGVAKPAENYAVSYRDYKGIHVVKGIKLSEQLYSFNPSARKSLTLATLDWPPYIGSNICRQGWVLQATIALLHRIGYGAKVEYYPWARALKVAESGKVDILFPEYFIEPEAPSDIYPGTRRLDHLVLSEAFGWGPVAFIKRSGYDLSHYKDLNSLANERIGVVRGYQNAPEFDRRMDMGMYKITQAKDDNHNLLLLLNNRVNLIVADPQVIRAEVLNSDRTSVQKQTILDQIEVVSPIIQMNGLYLALSKKVGKVDELLIELNQAINSFKKHGVFSEIQYQVKQECEG